MPSLFQSADPEPDSVAFRLDLLRGALQAMGSSLAVSLATVRAALVDLVEEEPDGTAVATRTEYLSGEVLQAIGDEWAALREVVDTAGKLQELLGDTVNPPLPEEQR